MIRATGMSRREQTRNRNRALTPSLLAMGGLLLAGLAGAAQPGQASRGGPPEEPFRRLYTPPSLPELLDRSQTVVAGEVLDTQSSWTPDRRQIFTTVTLRTDRRFKGGEASLVRFRIPGGTVGDTRLLVTHSPQFSVGERALVFLSGQSGRLPHVVAGEAGKRHLRVGDDGRELILPAFSLAAADTAGRTVELSTLDDLASALPRIEAARRR